MAAPLEALLARSEEDILAERDSEGRARPHPDYGPLYPQEDLTTGLPLLLLPRGFKYLSFGWVRDPMRDGSPTPGAHDGMAAFQGRRGQVMLVRNHEVSSDTGLFAPGPFYDPGASGGTTTLLFDGRRGRFVESWTSITGTRTNCAGGPTPWGTWLTCEETVAGPGASLTRPHGYIFEVPPDGSATAEPLRAMGRYVHEAVAVDPRTGIVYETEDAGEGSGLYRFVPNHPGLLAEGGTLQMLAIAGQPQFDTRSVQSQDRPYRIEWVTIPRPDPVDPGTDSVFSQGFAGGGARFRRLEGAWYGHGRIYFVSTNGGAFSEGQIWEYHPRRERLRLVFASPGASTLDNPDNITVSPRGGLVLCEDGSDLEYLHGLTVDGRIFRFAQNNVVLNGEVHGIVGDFRGSEFAGATYSPDGRWLFFNIQSPGITFAVTGPWGRGAL